MVSLHIGKHVESLSCIFRVKTNARSIYFDILLVHNNLHVPVISDTTQHYMLQMLWYHQGMSSFWRNCRHWHWKLSFGNLRCSPWKNVNQNDNIFFRMAYHPSGIACCPAFLAVSPVSRTYLKIGHSEMKSTGVRSSNELQGLVLSKVADEMMVVRMIRMIYLYTLVDPTLTPMTWTSTWWRHQMETFST